MRIFQFNINGEREWVAAETYIHAMRVYTNTNDMDLTDFEDSDDILELPETEWEKFTVKYDNGQSEQNFKQWMEENKSAAIIASTVYL